MIKIENYFALLLPLLAVGCASIVDGTNQSLSVSAHDGGTDLSGAQCTLINNKGTWFVNTPGSVTVHRSYEALNVTCKDAGFTPASVAVNSSTKAMAAGNILFGGLIGAGVDIGTGAAYDYPPVINVSMEPVPASAAAAAPVTSAGAVTKPPIS